jgi:hypothetical protein
MKTKIRFLSTLVATLALLGQTGAQGQSADPQAETAGNTPDHAEALTDHLQWQDQITEWRIEHLRSLKTLAEAQAAIFAHEAILEEHSAHVTRHGHHIVRHSIAQNAEGAVDQQEINRMQEAFQEEHRRLAERHGELQEHHTQLNERIAALRMTLAEVRDEIAAAMDETIEERVYGARPEAREGEEEEPEEVDQP